MNVFILVPDEGINIIFFDTLLKGCVAEFLMLCSAEVL